MAKEIERETGAMRLTPDEWIARLLPEGWTRADLDRLRDPTERIQWEVAEKALRYGIDVILDWGLWSRLERDELRSLALGLGAESQLHYCEAPVELILTRLDTRNRSPRSGDFSLDADDIHAFASLFEPPTEDEAPMVRHLQSSGR